ncbi:MAG: DUF370 domain-containing protein [Desulfovibrio sp.]|jgi:regulator of extracellular matrix RemA (YlzA/DUF370 family)|nr:DUF370 domain-containing protein [Desulfovibrio sp.]
MLEERLINIGFGNYVLAKRIVGVFNPASSPMKRLREDARAEGRLVDATQGRKTRSILVTDSHHVFLSSIQTETVRARFVQEAEAPCDAKD